MRQILLPPAGRHFEPFVDLAGKKWIRVAVWDTASNGVLVQPVKVLELKFRSPAAAPAPRSDDPGGG